MPRSLFWRELLLTWLLLAVFDFEQEIPATETNDQIWEAVTECGRYRNRDAGDLSEGLHYFILVGIDTPGVKTQLGWICLSLKNC